jgi:oxygen-independent coproporphyrinogen-3 oxidase
MKAIVEIDKELIKKYNSPVPRYTSYPTVPFWTTDFETTKWKETFTKQFEIENHTKGISLYVHLPFCESLCTYCGCNKRITTNHSVEEGYLLALEKEWKLYRQMMRETPVIRELHLGGGTPTFFSAANLERLVTMITKSCIVHPMHEFSIEGHPNNTTLQHLNVLRSLGFRRISYGVQDNDPEVQRLINRFQPFGNVRKATEMARQAGFTSVNFDVIYGLPAQTVESIQRTFTDVITLQPDRIAFYSYAHTPWTNKGQRLFDETNLSSAEEKLALYLKGKELLLANGYVDIGMDHFALKSDDLYKAWVNGGLHRNFMGYTTQSTNFLLGLGVSAISDVGIAFAQNDKALHSYYRSIDEGMLAVLKGYFLNDEDIMFRKNILDISCNGKTRFKTEQEQLIKMFTLDRLQELAKDGLVEYDEHEIKVTSQGHYFIRNICSAFDMYLQKSNPGAEPIFSKAI